MNALQKITEAVAAADKQTIVLPEGNDARVAEAAGKILAAGDAAAIELVLIGDAEKIFAAAGTDAIKVIDPSQDDCLEKYAAVLLRAREHKGMTAEQARAEITSPLLLAMSMVACGDADGCVAGAANTTGDVVRAALQIVGVKKTSADESDAGLVSSFFIMQHDQPHQAIQGDAVFADCALVVEPTAAQLARIAMDSADNAAQLLGLEPRVALLSFSTAGSAQHPQVDKVRDAAAIISQQRPALNLLPEVQFDAAVVPEILHRKAPDLAGGKPANIFIFPDLQSANIGYKIAERIGAARAVGPILQGLNRPVNDLSRGCDVDDIVALVAVTALQAAT